MQLGPVLNPPPSLHRDGALHPPGSPPGEGHSSGRPEGRQVSRSRQEKFPPVERPASSGRDSDRPAHISSEEPQAPQGSGPRHYLVETGQTAPFGRLVKAHGHVLGLLRPHARAAGSGGWALERRHHGLEPRTLGRGPRQQGRWVES